MITGIKREKRVKLSGDSGAINAPKMYFRFTIPKLSVHVLTSKATCFFWYISFKTLISFKFPFHNRNNQYFKGKMQAITSEVFKKILVKFLTTF